MLKPTSAGFPSVITLFSAPNYCDVYGNKGAILSWNGSKMVFKWFWQCPHPFWLPNLADAFSWSLPFIAEKGEHLPMSTYPGVLSQIAWAALDVLQTIMNVLQDEEVPSRGEHPLKKKTMVMSHVYGLLRQSGPEGATEFKTLPVEIADGLGSAANEAALSKPDFEHAYVSSTARQER